MAEHAISPPGTGKSVMSAIGRVVAWFGIVLSIGFVLLFVNAAVHHSGLFGFAGLDFGMFWAATRAFRHVGPLGPYDPHAIAVYSQPLASYVRPDPSALTVGQAPFPPLFFVAFLPFAIVRAPVGFALWSALSILIALFVTRRLATRIENPPTWLMPSLLFFFPLAFSIFLGQITILLMVGLFNAYTELEQGNDLRAGLWCGLLILKPQYLPVLLLVMLVKRRWQFLAGIGSVGAALGAISALMLGVGGIRDFYRLIVDNYIGFKNVQATVYPAQMISWRGFLLNVFPSAPERVGQVLTVATTMATFAVILWLWRGRWNPTDKRFHLSMFATVAAMLLCGYHSHLQDAALLLIPAVMVAASWRSSGYVQVALYLPLVAIPVVYVMTGIQGACFFTALSLIAILAVACAHRALPLHGMMQESNGKSQPVHAIQQP